MTPLAMMAGQFLGTVIVCAAGYLFLRVSYRSLYHLFLHESDDSDEVEVEGRFAYATSLYLATMVALLVAAAGICAWSIAFLWKMPLTWHWFVKGVTKRWVVSLGSSKAIGLVQVGQVCLFLLAGMICSIIFRHTILKHLFAIFLTEQGAQVIFEKMAHYFVVALAIGFGLEYLGLGGYVWQFFLVVSFGITMGIKDVILDIFSGVWLLFERSIEPTHYIEIDGFSGVILDIGVRKTLIQTPRGIVAMPNRNLMSKTLINWSKVNVKSGMSTFDISLGSQCSFESVREAVTLMAKKETRIYSAPQTYVSIKSLGSVGITFRVHLAIKRKYFSEQASVLQSCKETLYEHLILTA